MSYTQLSVWKKVLSEKKLCLALALMPEEGERKKVLEDLSYLLCKKGFEKKRAFSFSEVLDHFSSPSFFGNELCVIADEIDSWKKKDLDSLSVFLQGKIFGILLLGAKNKKDLLSIIKEVEKQGAVLDLITERFFDKKKRLLDGIAERERIENKKMALDAKEKLLEFSSFDGSYLEQELTKVFIFVGEKKEVYLEDVLAICIADDKKGVWDIAESLVWKEKSLERFSHRVYQDLGFFQSLIFAIRYQLQLGYKIASLLETKADDQRFFSLRIYPSILEKRKKAAAQLGSQYFKKALLSLFEIELLSRDGIDSFDLLLDLFLAKVSCV
jgi:DNA polymerase III delta subunit